MFVRLSFYPNQKISNQELQSIKDTLSDDVEYDLLYVKESGKIEGLWTYNESEDPENPEVKEGKKKLVKKSDFVMLKPDKEYLVDIDLFLQKHSNIQVKFRGLPKTIEKDYSSVIETIINAQNKLEKALSSFDKSVEFNEKCEVHIGNLGLLNINQVAYATDQCTESLQDILNKGWRILAVCPQPDQRRPDYILGKYNPGEDNVECVKF